MPQPEHETVCLLVAEQAWGSALQAMRSLAPAGVRCYVAVVGDGVDVYRRSRYCAGAAAFELTDPVLFGAALVAWTDEVAPGGAVVVLPLSDRTVEVLHRARAGLPSRFRLAIPEPGVVECLLDKTVSFTLAECAGLDVPPWVRIDRDEDLAGLTRLTMPVIVRPTTWSTTGGTPFGLHVLRDRAELTSTARDLLAQGATLLAQEYIDDPDREAGFAVVWRSADRTATAVCTGRKRREATAEGGVMAWGEAAHLPAVARAAHDFLDRSGFTGLGGIETLSSRGHTWFVGFNPHLEGRHFLAARAGVDTVRLAYDELADGRVPTRLPTASRATAWVGSAWLGRLRGAPRDLPTALRDRLRFALGRRRVKAVWSWADPVPGLTICLMLLAHATNHAVQRVHPRAGAGRTP